MFLQNGAHCVLKADAVFLTHWEQSGPSLASGKLPGGIIEPKYLSVGNKEVSFVFHAGPFHHTSGVFVV